MHINKITNYYFIKQPCFEAGNVNRVKTSIEKNHNRTGKLASFCTSLVASAALLVKHTKKTDEKNVIAEEHGIAGIEIKPEEYKDLRVIDYYTGFTKGIYVQAKDILTQSRIIDQFNPKEMEKLTGHVKTLHIAEDQYPFGSIAISSALYEIIGTDSLFQCAGVAFVDKSKNTQTLFHCSPFAEAKENRAILEYILSKSDPNDLEIYIVPGFYADTDKTIDFFG